MTFQLSRVRLAGRYAAGAGGLIGLLGLVLVTGCASGGPPPTPPAIRPSAAGRLERAVQSRAETPLPVDVRPHGAVQIDIKDVVGRGLPAKIELRENTEPAPEPIVLTAPEGRAEEQAPTGSYTAYVHVYDQGRPVLVDVQKLVVGEGAIASVAVSLLEGTSGNRPLLAFDQDGDGAIDRVEVACGTDPTDPISVPGEAVLPFPDRVFAKEAQWYRGELHAHSVHGGGRETVGQLIKRAEKLGLDFLAITDRNTMASCFDPAYDSDSVALIPAMAWGSDDVGVALIYGPRILPKPAENVFQAQVVSNRVQTQGGVFAVAHPCFGNAPWQWGVGYVNAVEVWCREWRLVPPMALDQLHEDLRQRHEGKLILSIAAAAATPGLSANGQAALFWDYELNRGLRACAIGGSGTASRDVPMAEPVTYIYAHEKSLPALLHGLHLGRTFVSAGLRGPTIKFVADVLDDGSADAFVGGIIPTKTRTRFEVAVEGAKGKKLQVLCNGYPIITKIIESDLFVHQFPQEPTRRSVYRVRIIDTPSRPGFGHVNVLALTSPIYAEDLTQEFLLAHPEIEPHQAWIELRRNPNAPTALDERVFSPQAIQSGEIRPKWQY